MNPSTAHRLRKHADYQRVYKTGRRQHARVMGYSFCLRSAEAANRSETAGPRVGLTVPKALGKAVDRNRIKRRLREAVRAKLTLLASPVDVVLLPRKGVLELEFALLLREVATIFRAVEADLARRAAKAPAASPAAGLAATPATSPTPSRP